MYDLHTVDLTVVVAKLDGELKKERDKSKRYWRQLCEQLVLHEASLEQKNVEIIQLKEKTNEAR